MIISGIYKLVNNKTKDFYVGSSKNIGKRWKRHLRDLNKNKHCNIILQRIYNKHGNIFTLEIIEITQDLLQREEYWISELQPKYNIGSIGGGDNITKHPNREELTKKLSISLKEWRNSLTEEDKRKISESKKGENNPNWRGGTTFCECGARISSNSNTCKKCLDVTGEKNPFYGKSHSEESKRRMRDKHLGKFLSPERKEKCRTASLSFYNSDEGKEYRQKLKDKMTGANHFLFGKRHREDSIEKMSKKKKENLEKMTIQERYYWNKMRKVRAIRIGDHYYFSLGEALKHYTKSSESLRFRCESLDEKWKNYEFIVIENFNIEKDEDIINKLIWTNKNPTQHS